MVNGSRGSGIAGHHHGLYPLVHQVLYTDSGKSPDFPGFPHPIGGVLIITVKDKVFLGQLADQFGQHADASNAGVEYANGL